MKKLPVSLLIWCLMFASIFVHAQTWDEYRKENYISQGDTLPYRLLYPENFDAKKQYPLILMLHGAGERGNDNQLHLKNTGAVFMKPENRKRFPAIVIIPQCGKNDFWAKVAIGRDTAEKTFAFTFTATEAPNKGMRNVLSLLDDMLKKSYVNKKQVYVGGFSMGGMGTYEILWRRPDVFAAAFPICGGGNPEMAKLYAKKVPVWVFHGALDRTVLPKYSDMMVQAIKQDGGNPKYTVYPNDKHNSWDSAYAESELFPWLFAHHK